MNISELIRELFRLERMYGDLPVRVGKSSEVVAVRREGPKGKYRESCSKEYVELEYREIKE